MSAERVPPPVGLPTLRAWRPEWAETLSSLPAVSFVLGCVAVASFVGMLVATARWNPSDHST